MDNSRDGSASPNPATCEPGVMLQRMMTHSTTLRRAFHISLSRRHDTQEWELLETATATSLEESRTAGHDAAWFTEASDRLRTSVLSHLRSRSSKSSRTSHYRRAADQVYENATAAWARSVDEWTVAYWKHCALVWITLWHMADVPDLTADQARECLNFSFTEESEPEPELPSKRPSRWWLSGAASSIAGAFRKNASA